MLEMSIFVFLRSVPQPPLLAPPCQPPGACSSSHLLGLHTWAHPNSVPVPLIPCFLQPIGKRCPLSGRPLRRLGIDLKDEPFPPCWKDLSLSGIYLHQRQPVTANGLGTLDRAWVTSVSITLQMA